jgi:hypothetical protein
VAVRLLLKKAIGAQTYTPRGFANRWSELGHLFEVSSSRASRVRPGHRRRAGATGADARNARSLLVAESRGRAAREIHAETRLRPRDARSCAAEFRAVDNGSKLEIGF